MAKVARKAAVRKAGSPAIKPVKQTLTKSALINLSAEENEIQRKTAAGVYATLENLFLGSVHPRGVGEFVLPGLLKVGLRKVPARRAGTLVRNPATGEMVKAAAKPASVRVKIRALSKLKTAAGSSAGLAFARWAEGIALPPAAGLGARDEPGLALGAGQQAGRLAPKGASRSQLGDCVLYVLSSRRVDMSVAFVREESAEAAQEGSPPPRATSAHPNLVTQSGLRALERALADSQQALKAAQAIADTNDRRRALELAARDVRYFAERVASAVPQPEPGETVIVAFGSQVTVLRDDARRQTFRIVGEDEADPRGGSIAYVSPLARLLIGKRVGEAVELDGREIDIVAIE